MRWQSRVVLVGNNPKLGDWDAKKGPALTRVEHSERQWFGNVKLDPSLAGKIEYKVRRTLLHSLTIANDFDTQLAFIAPGGNEHYERQGGPDRVWSGENRLKLVWEP